jgi:hypothetical protein
MFWVSFFILFILHVTVVLFFTLRIRPLSISEWMLLGLAESYLVAVFVYLSPRRARHPDKL